MDLASAIASVDYSLTTGTSVDRKAALALRDHAQATVAQSGLDAHLRALGALAVVDALGLPSGASATELVAALAERGLRVAMTDDTSKESAR